MVEKWNGIAQIENRISYIGWFSYSIDLIAILFELIAQKIIRWIAWFLRLIFHKFPEFISTPIW